MYKEYDDEFDRIDDELEEDIDSFVCPLMKQRNFNQLGHPFNPAYQRAASGPPSGPPPDFIPKESTSSSSGVLAVDPDAIRRCTYRFVYIWPTRGKGFWAFLVFVGRRSVAGWKWNGRRWIYFGMDLRSIKSFQCY